MRKRRVSYLFLVALVMGTGAAWLANRTTRTDAILVFMMLPRVL